MPVKRPRGRGHRSGVVTAGAVERGTSVLNPLEAQLLYPLDEKLPAPATRLEVAPGLFWIRMPLPFALDHVNLWLLRDHFDGRDGWTLIDCGIADATIRGLWERLIAEQLQGLPIVRVLCTHTHPDHVGLAAMLTERFGAPLWMTVGEYAFGRVLCATLPGANGESAAAHFRRHGMEPAFVEGVRNRNRGYFSQLVPAMPLEFTRIIEGQTIRIGERRWQVVVGLGHSPEHAALYCAEDRLLISGDMVLPRISTNVSVFDIEPLSNPVQWFLDSLKKYQPCDPDTLVLPSHGRPFSRLHVRLRQLDDHHQERLSMLLSACRERSLSAAQAVPLMFNRSFDMHQMTFALGEALAHLHALWYDGQLQRSVGPDGAVRFSVPRAG
jgi:glyoxylase-like metal-dependent hydrolase (beta-lactamase superfamily II)